MVWRTSANSPLGVQAPDGLPDTTPQVAVGTLAKFWDDVLGEGEFIYLPGVAGTVAGDVVLFDLIPGAQSTVRHSNASGSNTGRPLAVATSASVAGTWGWYQLSGVAIVNTVAGTVPGSAFATATAGIIGNTADPGDQILGVRISSSVGTPSAGKSYMTLNHPNCQSQIT